MERLIKFIAPRGRVDFAVKLSILTVIGNLLAMLPVYAFHGYLPSGLQGQIVEATLVGLPVIAFFLAIIAHMRDLQEQLARIAATDVLTGLPNRRAFLADIAAALDRGMSGHIVLADADNFKMVNDTFGHDVGDICLIAIAQHLRERIKAPAVLSRFGGEEFAIFLPDGLGRHVTDFGAMLCAPIPYDAGSDLRAVVTLSAGAVAINNTGNLKETLAMADKALYSAKAQGRARCVMASGAEVNSDWSPALAKVE